MNLNSDRVINFEEAAELLALFSCIETKSVESEKASLIQALQLFTSLSDYQNFGICADNSEQGFTALFNYLRGLEYEPPFNLAEVPVINEPIYLKFTTKKATYHLDRYGDKYRGVLISCQSEDDRVNGTYGYLPLDLF